MRRLRGDRINEVATHVSPETMRLLHARGDRFCMMESAPPVVGYFENCGGASTMHTTAGWQAALDVASYIDTSVRNGLVEYMTATSRRPAHRRIARTIHEGFKTMLAHMGDIGGAVLQLATQTLLEWLAYIAFVFAFKYRVGLERPLGVGRALLAASLAMVLNFCAFTPAQMELRFHSSEYATFAVTIAANLFLWGVLGYWLLKLTRWPCVVWALLGTLLSVVFDVVMVRDWVFEPEGMMIFATLAVVLVAANLSGRRAVLKRRFQDGFKCAGCGYDLTGNTSGVCSECGMTIVSTVPRVEDA